MSPIKSLTSLYSLLFAVALAGCGFQPMYAPVSDGSTSPKLEQVKVDVIADRSGQILRNYLLDSMTAENSVSNKYLLRVTLVETTRKLAYRRDETPRHEEITINASINLENLATSKVEYTDSLVQVASFSLGPRAKKAAYSATVAADSSREMALKALADDITLRVSGFIMSKDKAPHEG